MHDRPGWHVAAGPVHLNGRGVGYPNQAQVHGQHRDLIGASHRLVTSVARRGAGYGRRVADGLGAKVDGDVMLTQGEILSIAVGGQGAQGSSSDSVKSNGAYFFK